jgi:hypothetical protein
MAGYCLYLIACSSFLSNAHAPVILFREKMATTAKQAKTEEKNGAENADEQAGKTNKLNKYLEQYLLKLCR